ncbi:MAG: MFS transporter, partial [Gammaproteobacteria bacterium]|nr:MFS transporter [Gammaproteobacteria bacterium]
MQEHAWQNPKTLLILMSVAMPVAFSTWSALLNNFVIDRAGFTGVEIGILQSLRSAGVSFTINHIAAIVVPAALGLVWMVSTAAVFLIGAGFAVCS